METQGPQNIPHGNQLLDFYLACAEIFRVARRLNGTLPFARPTYRSGPNKKNDPIDQSPRPLIMFMVGVKLHHGAKGMPLQLRESLINVLCRIDILP